MRISHATLLSIAFVGLTASGGSAQAANTLQAVPAETLAANPDSPQLDTAMQSEEDRIICRREKPIGTNRTQRICRKASEVDTLRSDTHGALRNTRPTQHKKLP